MYQSNNNDNLMLIEDSVFNHCKSCVSGGAIYKKTKGQSVIQRTCGSYCQYNGKDPNEDGTFSNTFSTAEKGYLNYVLLSSVSSCYAPNRGYTIHVGNGESLIKEINSSKNIAYVCSAFYIYGAENVVPTADYVTVTNNTANYVRLLGFYYPCIYCELKQSKIIYNSQSITEYGLISMQRETRITSSYFFGNKGTIFFKFTTATGNYIIDNCIFGNGQIYGETIDTQKNAFVAEIDQNILNHISKILVEDFCIQNYYNPAKTCSEKKENIFHLFLLFAFLSNSHSEFLRK